VAIFCTLLNKIFLKVMEEKAVREPNIKESSPEQIKKLHPVVAIGASAGGLKAINELLENLPVDLGMTYVIIQHLSPTHESILPELLERKTKMKVHKVETGMHIEKNNVYVIPPNTFMSMVDSKLTLSDRVKSDGTYHPIDFFFNALAPIYQSKAIGIILSGSGTDGAAGIQQIKINGGITFAQDESAAFLSMPKAAVDSGFTDFVLSCEEIAKELSAIVKTSLGVLTVNEIAEAQISEIKKIQTLLHNKKDVDFGYYKQTTVNRRIMRRMALNKFQNISEYTKLVRENSNELELLYKDLLINVTSFFREPTVYEALTIKIFPDILNNRKDNDLIRIWTPACASGEEAYSIAICLYDYLQSKALSTPIQIFGTDLNETAIEKARAGIYLNGALDNVTKERLEHYFTKIDGHYQIIKPIRDLCVFATHNLLKDPPFSRMDLISCQNVMIYLETNPQKKILQAFHYALKPTGYLLLGKSETIGTSTELYNQVD
jgi:two-component system CheB/CheR fusion protein